MKLREIESKIIDINEGFPFVNNGNWAIHDLLPFLIKQYGKGDVSIATFSISEESVRAYFLASENISSLRLLLDYTVKKNKIEQLLFMQSCTSDIRLLPVHAKIFLYENENVAIAVIGSANQNNISRLESGYITKRPDEFMYYKTMFDHYYNIAIPV